MAEFTPVPVDPGIPQQGVASNAAGRPARPAGILRWGVALVTVALVVAAVSVGTVLLTSGAATSAIEGWIPTGTVMYFEARADLPGDQRQNVGSIIAKFPGFKDQATLDAKIDQALDQTLQTSGISWTTDLKPWVAGEVGGVITSDAFDTMAAAQQDPEVSASNRGGLLLVSVKDVAAATAWVTKMVGGAPSTTTYGDGTITTVDNHGMPLAWATRGTVLILGAEASVKAALDTKGASPVAASSSFLAARKAAPSAYLGFVYLDLKTFAGAYLALAGGSGILPQACLDKILAAVPDWAAGFAHAADGAIVMDQVEPAASGAPASSSGAKDTASAIAVHLPASTLVTFEARQAGPGLVSLWSGITDAIACDPSQKGMLDQLKGGLAAIGGLESLVGWAGDAAVAVTREGTTWGGGLAAIATDPAGATRTLSQLKAGLELAGGSSGIIYTEQPYAAGTIGIMTFTTPNGIPPFAATAQGDLFALGTVDFVKRVLDTPAGGGLAAQAGYSRAIDLAGGAGVADVYVNITGLREGLEGLMTTEQTTNARYETDVKPYLEPFDAYAAVYKAAAATQTNRSVLLFK